MKLATKFEFSSGGVVYRKKDKTIEFLLGKHSGYHKWVLPKGLVEKGENPRETAIREVKEEIGVDGRIIDKKSLIEIEYFYFADLGHEHGVDAQGKKTERRTVRYQENGGGKVRIHKKVVFFLMEYIKGDPTKHGWEMEDASWFSAQTALNTLAFDSEKSALSKAVEKLSKF
jgi:8-oxo-dGTP diphosphatase